MTTEDFIGIPYELGARGPERYDCWGVVWKYYKEMIGIELPQFPGVVESGKQAIEEIIDTRAKSDEWQEVETPKEGDLVVMKTRLMTPHVGVYVEQSGGRILHTYPKQTSCMEPVVRMGHHGIREIRYYRWSQRSMS